MGTFERNAGFSDRPVEIIAGRGDARTQPVKGRRLSCRLECSLRLLGRVRVPESQRDFRTHHLLIGRERARLGKALPKFEGLGCSGLGFHQGGRTEHLGVGGE